MSDMFSVKSTSSTMTSTNGNIFHVTGSLCGEFTGQRWIPRTKASDTELWCFLDLRLNKPLSNIPETGDLRRHRAHCDVNVMVRAGFMNILQDIDPKIFLPLGPLNELQHWTLNHSTTLHHIAHCILCRYWQCHKLGKYFKCSHVQVICKLYDHFRGKRVLYCIYKNYIYYLLFNKVDFKAFREFWKPLSKAVPGKFHGPVGHNKHNYLQDRDNFTSLGQSILSWS